MCRFGTVLSLFLMCYSANSAGQTIVTFADNGTAGFALSDNGSFVTQQYVDFLDRQPDPGGLNGWVNALTAGLSRAQLIADFMGSSEFVGKGLFVAQVYVGLLGRDADYGGFRAWLNWLENGGGTELGLVNAFLNSDEFQSTFGTNLTDTQFVTVMYQSILLRQPDSGGLNAWVSYLASGGTRAQVALSFQQSAEFAQLKSTQNRVAISLIYFDMLRRQPDSGGFSGWLAALNSGTCMTDVISGFLNSAEYSARFLTVAPVIASLSANSGAVGTTLTITGSNFGASQGSSMVTFNGTSAGTASAWSASSITVIVPSSATTGNVVVQASGLASNGVPFTVTQPADFSISVSSGSVSAKMGTTSVPVNVSVTALNGFSGSVAVNVSSLPAGIACSPSCPLTINAGGSMQLSFVVPANAMIGNFALTVQGTTGNLSHITPLTLDVTTSLQGLWNLWIDSLGVPQNPAPVSGKIFVSGWAFEGIPLTAVSVLVDNSAIGNAFYGTPRPDISKGIAGAPEDCGFSLALDTTKLSNGLHTVSVNVIDSANNVVAESNYPNGPLTAIQINVNNPAPTPTGPVANLSMSASTTSLTAGTIVQFKATATNGTGTPVSPSFSWSSTDSTIVEVTPNGAVLPLAAGTATIAVTAGGLTKQVPVTVLAGSGTPGSIQVSLGPAEVVYQYTRDACFEGQAPDSPAHATRLSDGSLLLITGADPFNFANVGADFYSLTPRCAPTLISSDSSMASTFMNREWIFAMYNDGSRIHALIHNEFHDPIAPTCSPTNSTDGNPCQYTSITYASSTDDGRTFTMLTTPQNVVAPPPFQWIAPAQGAAPPYDGYQEPTNIVHAADGYYYARFGAFTQPPISGALCVMRTATLSDPSSWRAWDGIGFNLQMTDPYTSPAAAFCANSPANVTVPYESLTFNTYLNMYMLVGLDSDFTAGGTPYNCGFHFALSSDLVHWTAQQLIAPAYVPAPSQCQQPGAGGLAGSFAYGSIIDDNDPSINFETPGRTPYLYYTRFNDNTENRDLVRVPVIITKY